jgi:hypothetical protein
VRLLDLAGDVDVLANPGVRLAQPFRARPEQVGLCRGDPATILVPMPFPALNANAVIQCTHAGKVTVIPKLPTVTIGGAAALRLTDVIGSPIICAVPPSPSSKPWAGCRC